MRASNQVLVVTERSEVAAKVTAWLENHATCVVVGPTEAARMISGASVGGLVLDVGGMPAGACRALVRDYALHQPEGRVALLAASEDVTTLGAITFQDSSVDMFFAPWDPKAVRTFLRCVDAPSAVLI